MKISCAIFLLLLVYLDCQIHQKSDSLLLGSDFTDFVNTLDPIDYNVETMNSDPDFEGKKLINPSALIELESGYLISYNAPGWEVILLDTNGKELDIQGGLGRGPNEFVGINSFQVLNNGSIIAIDKVSKEVEVYKQDEDNLIHEETLVLPNYYPLYLSSFISLDDVMLGVFTSPIKKLVNDRSTDTDLDNPKLRVYGVDTESLEIQEKLFDMPANESIGTIYENVLQDHPFGFETYWKAINGHIYYSNSESFDVHIMNVEAGKKRTISFEGIPKRLITQNEKEVLLKKFEPAQSFIPTILDHINEREDLPYFYRFDVTSEYGYFQIPDFTGEPEIILRFNLITKEKKKVVVPKGFVLESVVGNKVYGINYSANDENIIALTLKD